MLDKYQQDAYRNLMQIANRYGGAFLCDGVGLGKTYVGLMLIERLVFKEGKQVVLFAPKAAREDVWEPVLRQYLPKVVQRLCQPDRLQPHRPAAAGQVAGRDGDDDPRCGCHHHRRGPPLPQSGIRGEGVEAPSRYRLLQSYIQAGERPKQVFYLTATPINNSIHDFRHMIELFTGGGRDALCRAPWASTACAATSSTWKRRSWPS